MSIYTIAEQEHIAAIEGELATLIAKLRKRKGKAPPGELQQLNRPLLDKLKEYNALLDKQPIKQP